MRVLVTDGDSRAALAVTRSLGSAGHVVFVGSHIHRSLAAASRYCERAIQYPNPADDVEAFIRSLSQHIENYDIDVLLPISDITSLSIAASEDTFSKQCTLPFHKGEQLFSAADKAHIVSLCRTLNVPHPETIIVNNSLQTVELDFDFPIVIKPTRSRVRVDNKWYSTSVSYAHSKEDLQRQLASLPPHTFPVMLQRRIEGPGLGVFACADHGKIIACSSHKRIREKPPSGGVSVVSKSISVPEETLSYAEALLEELDWTGVAMVEFKVAEDTGVPYVMEINGRFWGSLQLAIDAGVDYPSILVSLMAGNTRLPALSDYKTGIHNRWLWGDVDALLLSIFSKREKKRLGDKHPGLIGAIRDFIESRPNQRFEVLRWSDPLPWIVETRKRLFGR